MERLTKRKRLILDILENNSPKDFATLNELRVKCRWRGEFKNSLSRETDERRSFNRTVLERFSQLYICLMAERHNGFYKDLTVGLFARWAVWELLDQGFLTSLPSPNELSLIVGQNACSAYINLKNGECAVVGNAVFLSNLHVIGTREFLISDLNEISKVPWILTAATKNGLNNVEPSYKLVDLYRLPRSVPHKKYSSITTYKTTYLF